MKITKALMVAVLLSAATVWANGTDAPPGAPVNVYPYVDTGFLDDTLADDITTYTGTCGLPFAYGAGDVFYQFNGATDSTYDFTLTSDTPGATDFAMFIVSDPNDGASCIINSQDSIDDANPELIAGFTPAADVTHYLVIDGFSDAPGYPAYGSWSLDIACTGSCPIIQGLPEATAVPTLGIAGLIILALLVAGFAVRFRS